MIVQLVSAAIIWTVWPCNQLRGG